MDPLVPDRPEAAPRPAVSLVAATDGAFRWLARGAAAPRLDLAKPAQAFADEGEIAELWGRARACRDCRTPAAWLIAASGEAVGLVSYRDPPRKTRAVEIGYGVSPAHRDRGVATEAVRLLIEVARADGRIDALLARSQWGNVGSARVLAANGFQQIETRFETQLGAVRRWTLDLKERG